MDFHDTRTHTARRLTRLLPPAGICQRLDTSEHKLYLFVYGSSSYSAI
jgi:hypothetical protein